LKPISHIISSGIIGAGVGAYYGSFECALISFIAGVAIDLDHFIDYYANHPFTLKLTRIYKILYDRNLPRLYLILHSYEIIIFLWFCIYLFSMGPLWKAAAIGLTQHLIFDSFTNPLRWPGYFFTYRLLKGFKKNLLFRYSYTNVHE